MKTKIIPFDADMAKDMQDGKIKGKIKTRDSEDVDEIVFFRTPLEHSIYAVINGICHSFTKEGYERSWDKSGSWKGDLVLEVPVNEQQFKVGDKVRIRPNSMHGSFVRERDGFIGKIVGTDNEFFVVAVTKEFQAQFTAYELELVEETGKHEFKPFDKVLVRGGRSTVTQERNIWVPAYYQYHDLPRFEGDDEIYFASGLYWRECIPYEGHEHLVGTTDEPKEE